MSSITQTIPEFIPHNWERETSVYTGDDLIDAYLKGKQAGKDETFRLLSKEFAKNLNKATKTTERLLKDAKKKGFSFNEILLKADGLTDFTSLFITSQQDITSEGFRKVYTLARRLRKEVENEDFYLYFSFLGDNGNLDERQIRNDGYFLRYDKK